MQRSVALLRYLLWKGIQPRTACLVINDWSYLDVILRSRGLDYPRHVAAKGIVANAEPRRMLYNE